MTKQVKTGFNPFFSPSDAIASVTNEFTDCYVRGLSVYN